MKWDQASSPKLRAVRLSVKMELFKLMFQGCCSAPPAPAVPVEPVHVVAKGGTATHTPPKKPQPHIVHRRSALDAPSDAILPIFQLEGEHRSRVAAACTSAITNSFAGNHRPDAPVVICRCLPSDDASFATRNQHGVGIQLPTQHAGSPGSTAASWLVEPICANEAARAAWKNSVDGLAGLGNALQKLAEVENGFTNALSEVAMSFVAPFGGTSGRPSATHKIYGPSALLGGASIKISSSYTWEAADCTLRPTLVLELDGTLLEPAGSKYLETMPHVAEASAQSMGQEPSPLLANSWIMSARCHSSFPGPTAAAELRHSRPQKSSTPRKIPGRVKGPASRELLQGRSDDGTTPARRERRSLMRAGAMLSAVPIIATLVELHPAPSASGNEPRSADGPGFSRLVTGRVLMQNDLSRAYWGKLSSKSEERSKAMLDLLFSSNPGDINQLMEQVQQQLQEQLLQPGRLLVSSPWKKVVRVPQLGRQQLRESQACQESEKGDEVMALSEGANACIATTTGSISLNSSLRIEAVQDAAATSGSSNLVRKASSLQQGPVSSSSAGTEECRSTPDLAAAAAGIAGTANRKPRRSKSRPEIRRAGFTNVSGTSQLLPSRMSASDTSTSFSSARGLSDKKNSASLRQVHSRELDHVGMAVAPSSRVMSMLATLDSGAEPEENAAHVDRSSAGGSASAPPPVPSFYRHSFTPLQVPGPPKSRLSRPAPKPSNTGADSPAGGSPPAEDGPVFFRKSVGSYLSGGASYGTSSANAYVRDSALTINKSISNLQMLPKGQRGHLGLLAPGLASSPFTKASPAWALTQSSDGFREDDELLGCEPSDLHSNGSGSDSEGSEEEAEEEEEWVNEGPLEEQEERWHEVQALPVQDPVTGREAVLIMQADVTARAIMEKRMASLTESQLKMLEEMFPRHVLEFVMNKSALNTNLGALAFQHEQVSILFMDIVGFTSMSKEVPPHMVMEFLNELFCKFDGLCDRYDVYKVETAGDCYIVAGALMVHDEQGFVSLDDEPDTRKGAQKVLEFSKAMLRHARTVTMPHNGQPTTIRIGIHTGSVVSGLIGSKLPKFSLFGDTMNTSSRMESTSRPGCVQISETTYAMLDDDHKAWFQSSGGVEVKGKGRMSTYIHEPDEADLMLNSEDLWEEALEEEGFQDPLNTIEEEDEMGHSDKARDSGLRPGLAWQQQACTPVMNLLSVAKCREMQGHSAENGMQSARASSSRGEDMEGADAEPSSEGSLELWGGGPQPSPSRWRPSGTKKGYSDLDACQGAGRPRRGSRRSSITEVDALLLQARMQKSPPRNRSLDRGIKQAAASSAAGPPAMTDNPLAKRLGLIAGLAEFRSVFSLSAATAASSSVDLGQLQRAASSKAPPSTRAMPAGTGGTESFPADRRRMATTGSTRSASGSAPTTGEGGAANPCTEHASTGKQRRTSRAWREQYASYMTDYEMHVSSGSNANSESESCADLLCSSAPPTAAMNSGRRMPGAAQLELLHTAVMSTSPDCSTLQRSASFTLSPSTSLHGSSGTGRNRVLLKSGSMSAQRQLPPRRRSKLAGSDGGSEPTSDRAEIMGLQHPPRSRRSSIYRMHEMLKMMHDTVSDT